MSLLKKKDEKKTEQEKVEERREEVLAKGRKFKYPLQWTKHRIVINTILISIIILAIIVVGGWLALYRLGMTDELLYRITKIVPASVATVDNEAVRFSDYLMLYRSSMTSIERQSGSQFDQSSVESLRAEYKRIALTEAEKYTFAASLAKQLDIEVTKEEVAAEFDRHLKIGGIDRSEEGFLKIISDNFGMDKSEYERMLYLSLLKSKVSIAIDENANKIAGQVEKLLSENNNNYGAVAEQLGDAVSYEETGGLVDSKNIDGGRASEAMKLEPGASSGKFVSMNGDGYYFVKLIKKTDSEANFVSIKVPFSEFDKRFNELVESQKINESIKIVDPNNQ
ncbi:SurA N-terminal domain-containing protein [Candidatus Saccharibacteria bacterium]|nr:SurA N-terminal domain-containing protein [Candidatus Saccharibacteria bacterium]MBQ3476187.1 SurA N-terminal domain-containing protein [Candidatus Saccharibacteria bacterium]